MIFASESERLDIIIWAKNTHSQFRANGVGRAFGNLSRLSAPHYESIKSRILTHYTIVDWLLEPMFEDYCGFNQPNAFVHLHSDPNIHGRIHTRINVVVSRPNRGGDIHYNNNTYCLPQAGESWLCVAGKYMHGTTPVVGDIPRIVWSFGFLLQPDDVNRLERECANQLTRIQ